MIQQPIVRVVLGEASEPHPGPVKWTLDVEGFDVVGQGSSREELERVLAGVAPTVIVVDDAIPASAVIALRAKAPSAGLVVVWPASVSSKAIADAHVDPGCIEEDLGRAVRRAARRTAVHDPPVAVGEPVLILPDADPEPVSAASWAPTPSAATRRSGRVLLGTAAVLALIVMMVGVSFALDATRRSGPAAGTTTTGAPAASSASTSSPAGSGSIAAGAAGHDRQDCGPRGDSGSTASSHAATAPPGGTGDTGIRSHGANCGGANAGGANRGGHANAGGSAKGHGAGSTGHGAGTGHASAPTDQERGSPGGRQDQSEPDPSETGNGGGSSNDRGRSDQSGRSDAHGSGSASHPSGR